MKITIIGYGLNPAQDLTVRSLQLMRANKRVLIIGPEQDAQALQTLGINADSIISLYGNGDADTDNYLRIYNFVLNDCRACSETCIAVPGNPGIGVTLIQMLIKQQEIEGYTLEMVAGVSSFDWLVLENQRDPIERGTCILDANRLLLLDMRLDPTLDYYIYHVCSVGTRKAWLNEPSKDNQIHLLRNKLLESFPADHEASLLSAHGKAVVSLSHCSQSATLVARSRIEDLDSMLEKLTFDCTLFIKGMPPKKINKEFLSCIQN